VEARVSETGTGPSPSQEAPGEQLGRYRLLKKIARGGMAEVFAARSFGAHGFEKTVAIKRILPRYGNDPQFVRMMVDEAKITVLLNHPNVATILELCEQDGDYFIVMEFVPGQSLAAIGKRLREKGEKLGTLEACFVVVELLQGLHAAHVQKEASGKPAHIIHRDVSPQNVLLSFDGHVKVIDFGIARAMHRLEMTEVGTIKGKLRYLAPEMIDPARFMMRGDFDHRVDVFAAGIVLWELIAGRTLYQGDDEMVVYDAITDSDAPDLSRMGMCDAGLAKIVAKALSRDPEKRYLTAEDFADELRAYVYRTDPSFTHKRLAAVLERLFPNEKEEMLALERGSTLQSGKHKAAPRELPREKAAEPTQRAPEPEPARIEALPGPRQVAPDEPTRTQAVSGEHKKIDLAKMAKASPSTKTRDADGATKQMRSADSNRKLQEAEAKGGKKAIPVEGLDEGGLEQDGGPVQGDVLTVMTLVSKSGSRERRASSFKEAPETLTANEPPSTRSASARTERAGLPEERVDETPYTKERSRSLPRTLEKPKPRLFLLAAASGVGIALIGVVALELSRPAAKESDVVVQPIAAPVRISVTSRAAGAVGVALGREVPLPTSFSALPGDSLEIVVRAPGYREKSTRLAIPRENAKDLALDVELDAEPVPLVLTVTPPDATVLVDEMPYRPRMLLSPGKPVMLHVSAPGYLATKKEIEVAPGVELPVSIDLVADDKQAARPAEKPPEKKNDPPRPVVTKPATLVLKTKDMWGQVTIDGKTYDETTPLTVELKAGKHTVVVAHPPKGYKKSFTMTLKPGETASKTIDFN
jgi:serine/threonine protein kinase